MTMITSNCGASSPKRGAFILLEGVDRCGKTTQVSLLVKHLVSLSIATAAYRFPDRTTQGEQEIPMPIRNVVVAPSPCGCHAVRGAGYFLLKPRIFANVHYLH
jgi:hypothetical protein